MLPRWPAGSYHLADMAWSRQRSGGQIVLRVIGDVARFVAAMCRPRAALAAENLFLRKQLALYIERQAKPRRADDATRIALVALSALVDWRRLLTVVQPETLLRWHRTGFRLFWRWKSKPRGRPRIPAELRQLIGEMANANRTWGEERIASELLLKLGIRVSPRTVRRYMPATVPPHRRARPLAWSTFVRNHAHAVLACDFFVVATATFRVWYVFVVLEIGTRRILHWNVTRHPNAAWTAQQFRMITPGDQRHQYVLHDRDTIYSEGVDRTLTAMDLTVLKTPVRAPQANAFCERLIGTMRRECLDFLIPLNERHLRWALTRWVCDYNRGRPHASLGPGIPEPNADRCETPESGHRIPTGYNVTATPILGGLHHEYRLEAKAA
jgi:putative transposase